MENGSNLTLQLLSCLFIGIVEYTVHLENPAETPAENFLKEVLHVLSPAT